MRIFLPLLAAVSLGFPLHAQDKPAAAPGASTPTVEEVISGFNKENKHIHIDTKNKWVDFDAKVCLKDAPMLEVLVCTPMTREHESILVSEAKPSQIHLALLLLGLEPGSPRRVRWVGPNGDQPMVIPATGPEVELFFVTRKQVEENGKQVDKEEETPANHWLLDEKTRKEASSNRWLFTGSYMAKTPEGASTYVADGEGNVISVVQFGDETIAPHNEKTKDNNSPGEDLGCNTAVIPPVNTPIVVRIKPVKKSGEKTAEKTK